MPAKSIVFSFALLALTAMAFAAADYNQTFDVARENFSSTGKNPYFILEPGHRMSYEGKEDGEPAKLVITVLNETKQVDGVETRIVEERESAGGKLIEVSRNYFAIDKTTNNAYYFGEEVDMYKDGKVSGHEGSWEAGKDGAKYGMFMPANPMVGQKFYQEVAPEKAMDRVEIISLDEKIEVPAGKFDKVCKTLETTPLEPDTKESKWYAPGVGLLIDGNLKLVKHGKMKAQKQAKAQSQKNGEPQEKPLSREALAYVGADPMAEAIWVDAINDPNLSAHERSDLIEDLNEEGFADPKHPSEEEIPLIENRLALIESLAPDAMDEVNAAAFDEAYKDLVNMYNRLQVQ
jgi:hypothetical protein